MSKPLSTDRTRDGATEHADGGSAYSGTQLDLIRDWLGNSVDQPAEIWQNPEESAASNRAHANPDDASILDARLGCSHLESGETSEGPAPEPAQDNGRLHPESEGAASEPETLDEAMRSKLGRIRKAKGVEGKPIKSGSLHRQQRFLHRSSLVPSEPPHFLNVQNVAHRYDVSVATIWRAVADGSFPKPRKIIRNVSRWAVADLDAYDRAVAQP